MTRKGEVQDQRSLDLARRGRPWSCGESLAGMVSGRRNITHIVARPERAVWVWGVSDMVWCGDKR